MRRFLAWPVLFGLLACSGCMAKALPRTEPEGEVLKQLLERDGNPTSYRFHADVRRVEAAVKALQYFYRIDQGEGSDGSLMASYEARLELTNRASGYFQEIRPGEPLALGSSCSGMKLRLVSLGETTRVEVETKDFRVECVKQDGLEWFPDGWCSCCFLAWPCNPLPHPVDCLPVYRDCSSRSQPKQWPVGPRQTHPRLSLPSDTVWEYSYLERLGKILGEKGMPEARRVQSAIKVIP